MHFELCDKTEERAKGLLGEYAIHLHESKSPYTNLLCFRYAFADELRMFKTRKRQGGQIRP